MIGNIIKAAAAGVPAAFALNVQFVHQHRVSAADTLPNINCLWRAVPCAGAAFHAGISISYRRYTITHGEDLLRAYFSANTAPVTFILVHRQGNYIFQVLKFHDLTLRLLYEVFSYKGNYSQACRSNNQGQGNSHLFDYPGKRSIGSRPGKIQA